MPHENTKAPIVLKDGDDDEDYDDDDDSEVHKAQAGSPRYKAVSPAAGATIDPKPWRADCSHSTTVPNAEAPIVLKDDDDDNDDDNDNGSDSEEEEDADTDPTIAAIKARARARFAAKRRAAAEAGPNGETVKAPIAQLFITPEMPNASPLMVRVRIDNTIEKPRLAWCAKQGFSPQMTRNVFFTWKGSRVYDSSTIKRLGIQVDRHGNVSVDGDTNIYDDENVPKIHVQAWTPELFKQRKAEEAAEAVAKRLAAETPAFVKVKTLTPEPAPVASKLRITLKAKGRQDWPITVHPVCNPLTHLLACIF